MTVATVEKKRAGRKTDLEREERELKLVEARREVKEAQLREAAREKQAKPLDARRRSILWLYLGLAGMILTSSALFSFATIADVANWMQPSWPWLVWVVPFFIEAFILCFGIDAVVNESKAHDPDLSPASRRAASKDAFWALIWMLVFSGVAVIGNAAHTLDGWDGQLGDWRAWVGTAFAALAPLSVVLVVKRVSKMVFARPE